MSEKKYSLFLIEGGLGKHVAATAVARCIKNNYPDRELIVLCPWAQVFLNLPFVDRVFRLGHTSYFYQEYVEGKDSLIFKHEPYFTTEHIHKKTGLIENWCNLYGLKYNNEKPELRFNLIEQEIAYTRWGISDKPVFLIQTHGGMFRQENSPGYRWTRDMPMNVIQEVVDAYSESHTVLQVTREQSPVANGAIPINQEMSCMELLSVLLVSQKRLLIDSCLQHAAAALNMPSTVLWVGTSPKVFGYNIHKNICANMPDKIKLPDSVLFDFSFDGVIHECPFDQVNFFDTKAIISSLDDSKKIPQLKGK